MHRCIKNMSIRAPGVGYGLWAMCMLILPIKDKDGTRELPTGEIGELWARGPMVVKGYWNNPEATARVLVSTREPQPAQARQALIKRPRSR